MLLNQRKLLAKIVLSITLAVGNSGWLRAHDLPMSDLQQAQTANTCFDFDSAYTAKTEPGSKPGSKPGWDTAAAQPPAGQTKHRSPRAAAQAPNWSLRPTSTVINLYELWHASSKRAARWIDALGRQTHERGTSLSVAMPAAGNAPAPIAVCQPPALEAFASMAATRPAAKKTFVEDYLPYDLAVRDWQLHPWQFPSRTPEPIVPIAENGLAKVIAEIESQKDFNQSKLAPGWIHEDTLAAALRAMQDLQCRAANELQSFAAAKSLVASASARFAQAKSTALQHSQTWLAAHLAPQAEMDTPLFIAPQFVMIQSSEGDLMLVTAAQARQLSAQLVQNTIAHTVVQTTSALEYCRKQAVSSLRYSLHTTGIRLLQLADSLEPSQPTGEWNVASQADNGEEPLR